ncbi:hypothetical protein [Jatrophihabitans sp.]|uniref:hypothetical protein n=1 Tax=Jatrophihabitans sp. TaxID=1932789 RepID=UPI002B769056|nr:hypothetical protein [Jatrophihabitans sp.]
MHRTITTKKRGSSSSPSKLFRIALTLLLSSIATLTGCDSGSTPCCNSTPPECANRVAIVAAQRANQPKLEVKGKLSTIINCAVEQHSTVAFFLADGNPDGPYKIIHLTNNGNNSGSRDTIDDQNRTNVRQVLQILKAKISQSNPLQAINLAADWLAEEDATKQLVILDSGLQTVAPLRFEDNLLNPKTNAKNVVSAIIAAQSIPHLENIDVIWLGMGQSTPPQQTLTSSARNKELEIWRGILSQGNPKSLDLKHQIKQQPSVSGLPEVSTVPVTFDASATGPSCAPFTSTVTWKDVSFKGETAELVDPAAAKKRITKLASELVTGNYHSISLKGTTADWGDLPGQKSLARLRAIVVERLLTISGVQPKYIASVEGLGSEFAGHVNEYDSHGKWNEELAALNRQVIVLATAQRCQ